MDKHTQNEIAQGLQAGSARAWLSLHEAYGLRVWRDVARLTGADSADVADIVQETFLAAARSTRGFDSQRGTLWSWLWGIARRQTALHFRKTYSSKDLQRAQQRWALLNEQQAAANTGTTSTPLEHLASHERATLVREALNRLPAEYQMLLAAKYMDNTSTKQIALETGISPAAVDSKLARARKAFRQAFAKTAGSSGYESEVRT